MSNRRILQQHCSCAVAGILILLTIAIDAYANEPESRALSTVKDLLPVPACVANPSRTVVPEKLSEVREVEFKALPTKLATNEEAKAAMDRLLARINDLNSTKPDRFIQVLRGERSDLANLPFVLGDACRSSADRSRWFKNAVEEVRKAEGSFLRPRFEGFWDSYESRQLEKGGALPNLSTDERMQVTQERYKALMQIFGIEDPRMLKGLVRHIGEAKNADAARALVALAVYSTDDEVRSAACEALKEHRAEHVTPGLLKALRYPLPAVVWNAAEAVARLKRDDLTPQMAAMLDAPDPRAPTVADVGGKRTWMVRESVRVNHAHGCLLCHAPADKDTPSTVLTARVTFLDNLPPPTYYAQEPAPPNLFVRIDVTYLRQDFSALLPLPPQGEQRRERMARFDFLVQERTISEEEKQAITDSLALKQPGQIAPHQAAIQVALRKLTGKDAPANSAAWRNVLKLSE